MSIRHTAHWILTSAAGGDVDGSINVTLADVTSASTALIALDGNLQEDLEDVVSTSTGVVSVLGSITETLDDVTSVSAGTITVDGSVVETLDDVTSVANGVVSGVVIEGSIVETLDDVTSAANGTVPVNIAGSVTETLDDVTSTATGVLSIEGAVTETLEDVVSAANGTVAVNVAGSIVLTLDDVTSASNGTTVVSTTIDGEKDLVTCNTLLYWNGTNYYTIHRETDNDSVREVSSDYTTAKDRVLICTNTTPITITLNSSPDNAESLKIKRTNALVTLVSNTGIDGSSSVDILNKYDSPHIVYTEVANEWSIV